MLEDKAIAQTGPRTQYVPTCPCLPASASGVYLWGILLMVGGSVWLLNNFNLLPQAFVEAFWPLVLVGLGIIYLTQAAAGKVKRPVNHGGPREP